MIKSKESVNVKVVKLDDIEREIVRNLYQNREGLRVVTLKKLIRINERTLYRKLNNLKKKELIENIYPIWKLVNGQSDLYQTLLKDSKIFELHNLSYVLKLMNTPDWWNKRKPRLQRLKGWQFSSHSFGKNNSNPYQQILNENFVVQTYPQAITIIHRKRYYSNNPYELIQEGINETLDLIEFLEERFRFKFFPEGIPALEIRNNDFNRLKDHLAEHCKKEGRRFLVELDKNRKVWVDYSEPFGKEANYPEGQEILEKVTKDHLLNKPMLNSELQQVLSATANQIQQVVNNQEIFDRNISLHQRVLEEMSETLKVIRDSLKKDD